jgi:PAS domain S-box-containing protein
LLLLTTKELTQTRGFSGAWILRLDHNLQVIEYCVNGRDGEPPQGFNLQNILQECACAVNSLKGKRMVVVPEPDKECQNCFLVKDHSGSMIITAPLIYQDKKYGVLAVSGDSQTLTAEDSALLQEIAGDIAFFLFSMETQAQRGELEQAAARYLDIAGVMIVTLDRNGRIKLVNKKCAAILGYPENELIGVDWFSLTSRNPETVREAYQKALNNQASFQEHSLGTLKVRDGSWKIISWYNALIRDPSGNVVGSISSGEDITERQKAEDDLKESEKRFHLLFQSMTMGVIYHNAEGEIISMNPAAEYILGVSLKRILESRLIYLNLQAVHQDGSRFLASEHPAMLALKTGKAVRGVVMGITPPGQNSRRWIVLDAVPQFREGESQPYQSFGTFSDITDLKDTAEKLASEQKFLDNIIENTPNPLWISDAEGTIIRMNQALRDLLQVTDEEIIGKYNVLRDKQILTQGNMQKVEGVFKEGKTVSFTIDRGTARENRIQTRSSPYLVLDVVISPVFNEKGQVVNAICQYKDITLEQADRLALQKSEENFRSTLETLPMGVHIYDDQGQALYVNQALLDIYGFKDLAEYNSTPIAERYTEESYREHLKRRYSRIKAKDITGNYLFDIRRKDGSVRHLEASRKEILWNGELKVLGLYADVTQRVNAEHSLQESERKYRSLINNVKLGIFRANRSGYLDVNPAMEEITGYSRDELLKMPIADLYVNQAEQAEVLNTIGTTLDKLYREFKLKKKDQTETIVAVTDTPIRNEAGEIMFVDGIMEDISERKNAEAKLLEIEALKQSNKAKSELLANVSHELRTPLASIKGFIESLIETDVKWTHLQQQDFLESANREVDRLTFLIRDLLDMSRIESGKMVLDRRTYSVQDILDSALPVITGLTKRHELKIAAAPGLPAIQVDKLRIAQVITNLVENATKFSPAGSLIKLEASANLQYLTISVADQGEGMSQETLASLFNRFYQAERAVSGKTKGTGLGLAICKGIVEAHGGRIWVESEPGKGSKFTFILPLEVPGLPANKSI